MSEEPNNTNASASSEPASEEKKAQDNKFAAVLAIKDSNPKLFYGAIGGVVLVILLLLVMGGGSDANLPKHQSKDIVVGQNYILKSANAADTTAPIKLVAAPGTLAAFDDTEEADRTGCKVLAPNTPVKALQMQDAFGKKNAFVQVEITSGECQNHKGWVLAVNLQ